MAVLGHLKISLPIPEVTRKLGNSEATFYRGKKLYSRLEHDQAREPSQLQDEKETPKEMVGR